MYPFGSRRVVVTGMGFVTPIGCDQETVWSNLAEGRSGVGPITRFDATSYPTRIAAEVKDFDPLRSMDRKTARHSSRYSQFAVAAARQALSHAGLDPAGMDADQVGAVICSGIGGLDEIERNHQAMLERGIHRLSPFTIPMMLCDTAAGLVAIETGALGPNYGLVSACASSGHGIGEAAAVIARGDATVMLAGGGEAGITPLRARGLFPPQAPTERN